MLSWVGAIKKTIVFSLNIKKKLLTFLAVAYIYSNYIPYFSNTCSHKVCLF